MASVISCGFQRLHKARLRDWGLNMQREKLNSLCKSKSVNPGADEVVDVRESAPSRRPACECKSVYENPKVWAELRQKHLLGSVSRTNDEMYPSVQKTRSIKTDVSEGGRHIIRPLQQTDASKWSN